MASRFTGLTRREVGVICLVILGLALLLAPTTIQRFGGGLTDRTVCMSNLASIGKALVLYRADNDNAWPWIANVTGDWSRVPTGTNRGVDPAADPNDAGPRSITALMFLLVRDGQPVKLFVCPSTDDVKDNNIVDDANTPDDEEPPYFWDFSSHRNVSYSWQAPILDANGPYAQGLSDAANDSAVIADQTPAVGPERWDNTAWDPKLEGAAVEPHVSPNHQGVRLNLLYVGMNVSHSNRPDVGEGQDMIYTASGRAEGGSRSATSVDLADHRSRRDSFLIGPVPSAAGPPAP